MDPAAGRGWGEGVDNYDRSWDVAARVIIAREAGAVVLDYDGRQHTTGSAATIATPPGIRDELLALVRTAINAEEHAHR